MPIVPREQVPKSSLRVSLAKVAPNISLNCNLYLDGRVEVRKEVGCGRRDGKDRSNKAEARAGKNVAANTGANRVGRFTH